MPDTTSQNPAPDLVRVTTHRSKSPRTGKIRRKTYVYVPVGVARKTQLRKGKMYRMVEADDGTITLSPVNAPQQHDDERRKKEIVDALEATHQQFGNALRRLAQ
jgi:hypothetical protein